MEFEDFDSMPAATEEEQYEQAGAFELPPPPAIPVPSYEEEEEEVEETVVEQEQIYNVFDAIPQTEVAEDALTKFYREWNQTLEEKRAKEYEFEKSARDKANEEMAAWKQQREVRLNAKKDKNRTEEQVLVESFESEREVFKVWDRVSKLIDTNEAAEKKDVDTSRMRKLFIQLKNEPLEVTRAAAASAE